MDYYALGRDYSTQRATKLDPNVVDTLGSDANIFHGSSAVLCDHVTKQLAYSTGRLLIDGAFEEDLDRLAYDRYSEFRKGASGAIGTVRFSRPTAAAGSGTVPAGTKLVTSDNVEYITLAPASFGIAVVDNVTATVRAVQAGKATQVGANRVQKISQPALLWDRTLVVNNDLATAGGEDREDDDTFKNRLRQFWTTARRGILSAIELGALSVPGVVSASAQEVTTASGQPARVVNLYIADSSGVANSDLAALVSTALLEWRAAGIAVIISTSIPTFQSVALVPQFVSGVDTVTLAQLIRAAVVNYINSLPVNGTLLLSDLQAVLARFKGDGLITSQGTIASPAGDVVPGTGQTLRTTTALVTVNGQ